VHVVNSRSMMLLSTTCSGAPLQWLQNRTKDFTQNPEPFKSSRASRSDGGAPPGGGANEQYHGNNDLTHWIFSLKIKGTVKIATTMPNHEVKNCFFSLSAWLAQRRLSIPQFLVRRQRGVFYRCEHSFSAVVFCPLTSYPSVHA
jgi:hypothetical protein